MRPTDRSTLEKFTEVRESENFCTNDGQTAKISKGTIEGKAKKVRKLYF